jgi:hypothetical protein
MRWTESALLSHITVNVVASREGGQGSAQNVVFKWPNHPPAPFHARPAVQKLRMIGSWPEVIRILRAWMCWASMCIYVEHIAASCNFLTIKVWHELVVVCGSLKEAGRVKTPAYSAPHTPIAARHGQKLRQSTPHGARSTLVWSFRRMHKPAHSDTLSKDQSWTPPPPSKAAPNLCRSCSCYGHCCVSALLCF